MPIPARSRGGTNPRPHHRSAAATRAPAAHATRKSARSRKVDSRRRPPAPHRPGASRRSSRTVTTGCTQVSSSPATTCPGRPCVSKVAHIWASVRAGMSHRHSRRGEPLASQRNPTPASGEISTTWMGSTTVSRPSKRADHCGDEEDEDACDVVPRGPSAGGHLRRTHVPHYCPGRSELGWNGRTSASRGGGERGCGGGQGEAEAAAARPGWPRP